MAFEGGRQYGEKSCRRYGQSGMNRFLRGGLLQQESFMMWKNWCHAGLEGCDVDESFIVTNRAPIAHILILSG